MPDYGMLFKNDSGEVLVDSLHPNLIEAELRSVWLNDNDGGANDHTVLTLNTPLDMPVFYGIRADLPCVAYGVEINAQNQATGILLAGPLQTTQGYVQVRVFSVSGAPNLDPETHGLEIYAPDGKIVFTSREDIGRIFLSGSLTFTYDGSATVAFTTDKYPNVWIGATDFAMFVYNAGTGKYDVYRPYCQLTYNGSNNWTLTIMGRVHYQSNSDGISEPSPWTVPYVVFV